MLSVTIEPVPGYKVSVSYLAQLAVRAGHRVGRGEVIGVTGSPHGSTGAHLSLRIDGEYATLGAGSAAGRLTSAERFGW